jgi:hypothetical protein
MRLGLSGCDILVVGAKDHRAPTASSGRDYPPQYVDTSLNMEALFFLETTVHF